jgi:3-dehydroquinate synthetase
MGLRYLFKVTENDAALRDWEKLAKALNLPIEKLDLAAFPAFDVKSFVGYLEQDKKKSGSALRLVLVKGVGACYVEEVPLKDFKARICAHAEFKCSER